MNGLSFLQQVLLSNHTVLDTGDTYRSQSDDVRLQCQRDSGVPTHLLL